MVKISLFTVFLVAPVVLAHAHYAQYGHSGYNYRAPQVNTQQAYFSSAQDSQNRFGPSAGSPRVGDHQAQQRPIQQQSQYDYQGYNAVQSGYQNVYDNRYNHNFAANYLGAQSTQQTAETNLASSPGYVNTQVQQPVITKHIYFHLPPDDSAAAEAVAVATPKKIYNIIFIKLPSQKSSNAARFQQLINQQAANDKTLIYVLVKKPESQYVQPVTSKPEVFFVKYKEPRSVALQGGPGLLPGLINGHGN